MNKNKIPVAIESLKKLLEKNLIIPEYQRAYTWGFKNIDKMIDDLLEFQKSNSNQYYMGSILLHKENNENYYNIIDGQQRITTLLLLFIVLKVSTKDMAYDNLLSQQKIKENYYYLVDKQAKKDNNFLLLKDVFEKICFTIIITDNEDDAFTFFDTQNSRGVQPSVLVLLKAFNLRCINRNKMQIECATAWDNHERDKKNSLYEESEKLEWLIKIFFYRVRNWRGHKKADFGYYDKFRDSFTKEMRKTSSQEYKLFTSVKNTKIINEEFETIEKVKNMDWFDFAVRQPIYQGEGFFKFIDHYSILLNEVMNLEIHQGKTFDQLLKIHKSGSVYMASFLLMITLTYFDRFGKYKIDKFVKAINDILADIRLKSSRILKQTLEIHFIRCETQYVEQNILDFICGAFDSQEVLEWIKKPDQYKNDDLDGVRKAFYNKNNEFWGI